MSLKDDDEVNLVDRKSDNMVETPCVTVACGGFSAKDTLTSGQCFRWSEHEGRLCGTAFGRYVEIEQRGDALTIYGADDAEYTALWRDYLDMERDYEAIRRAVIGLEPRLDESAAYAAGVHLLAQEPWEALCSFVISQNNNIPRIRGIIGALSLHYGAPALRGEMARDAADGHAFPTAEALAGVSEERLRELGCGYRAPYLTALARSVADGKVDFEAIRKAPIDEARRALLSLRGVGPKVAECALLYGFGRLECFPIDVWIRRALETEFTGGTALIGSEFAGVAQQYIFEYIRHYPERFVKPSAKSAKY